MQDKQPNQIKTFLLKTEVKFTNITIETIIKNRKYVAVFQSGIDFMIDCRISGNSVQECIDKTSKFLGCEIDEKHYIIK
jgi:hypothetical protein